MNHAGWIVFAAVLGVVIVAWLVRRRARVRRAIEELDQFALLTEARWEGDALLCRIAGGTQLRVDVTTLTSIDWREYGDSSHGRDSAVAFTFAFAGIVPPVALMGSGQPSGPSEPPTAIVLKGLKQRRLIAEKPSCSYGALSPVTNEALRQVSIVRPRH